MTIAPNRISRTKTARKSITFRWRNISRIRAIQQMTPTTWFPVSIEINFSNRVQSAAPRKFSGTRFTRVNVTQADFFIKIKTFTSLTHKSYDVPPRPRQSRVALKAAGIHFKRLFSVRVTTADEIKFTCERTTHELSLKSKTNFNELRIVALVYNIAELCANFCRRLISRATAVV